MIVYFAGCMATYREKNIAKTTIELLQKLGVEFTMLGKDEWCCGSVMLRSGNTEVVKQLMEHNVNAFKNVGADTVITSCAGCYRTIKQDYPKYLGELDFEILHTPDYVLRLVEAGKIKFKPMPNSTKITYHDPCHLGRHMNIYDPPRKVLQAIEGVELVEMERARENARCCGSGGGVSSAYKSLSNQMADTRLKDAIDTQAKILTSACPFCTYALKSAAERAQVLNNLKVVDFSELVLDQI
ncbi:(Fe-S)-binding protein [[Eubacterium] cellulosolvens]